MFTGIVSLIIFIALIVVIVRAIQGRSDLGGGGASVSLRRFFQYVVLLGLMIVVALGLAGLLAEALPESGTIARRGSADVARALAFTVVGGPLFVGMAVWTRRRLEADPNERDSLGWTFYLTVSLLIGLAVVMTVGVLALNWALSDGDLDTTDVSQGVVWAAVWALHWLIARRAIAPLRMTAHVLAGSAAGLGVLAASVVMALTAALNSLYSEAFETLLFDDLDALLLEAASLFVVGGLTWWWYWIRVGAKTERTTLWNAYVLLLGVLGGLLTALVAAGTLIARALEWYLGDPEAQGAADHFDFAPEAATALLIGAAVWLYHRFVLGSGQRTEVHRTYDYIVSGVGLLAGAAGVASAIIALLDAATEPAGVISRSSQDEALVAAITLLIIGVPLWWVTWSKVRRRAAADPDAELGSGARRIYLFGLLGIGAITAIITLIILVFTVLQDLLDGNLGTRSIRDAQGAIGVLLASLAVAGYHWTVYQEDRAVLPEQPKLELREVVFVGPDAKGVAKAISAAIGVKVHAWERTDAPSGVINTDDVLAALKRSDEEQVLVVQKSGSAFEVIPIRR
jgi:hypothetical protein